MKWEKVTTQELADQFTTDVTLGKPSDAVPKRPSKITTLKNYLLDKVEESDWHAVSDAANDIRVLEAEIAHHE